MAELEQFCILARSQKSRACAALIQQVLNHRKIYLFGELLSVPSVQSLKDSDFSTSFNSLELFAFGTYTDYAANRDTYLELSEAQVSKLKHLTVASLASSSSSKLLSYDLLMRELHVDNVRSMEDLVIEAVYAGLVDGKLDQRKKLLRVKSFAARDVRHESIGALIDTLTAWRGTIADLIADVNKSSQCMAATRIAAEMEQRNLQHRAASKARDVREALEMGVGDYSDEVEFYRPMVPSAVEKQSVYRHYHYNPREGR